VVYLNILIHYHASLCLRRMGEAVAFVSELPYPGRDLNRFTLQNTTSRRSCRGRKWLVRLVNSCCSHLEHRASVKRFVSLQFLNLRHSLGLLGRVISPSQGRYLTQTQNEHKQTSMPRVGFETTTPAFERAKTVHALDRAATVIGCGRTLF
jgi:hypothetical protein